MLNSFFKRLYASQVWRSIFRHGWPDNPLDRSLTMTSNVFLHLHPVKVKRKSLTWYYSFGLGVITVILFGVLVFTGLLLMFYYVPSVERAYPTMKEIQISVPLGQFTRNMHRWAAHGMVLVVILHMIRVFYTGAYKPPREFNWIIGVILLLLTLGASFTGYLLPWDQLSFWAITVGTNIAGYAPGIGSDMQETLLGGSEVGQNTLIRFYSLHIAILPLLIGIFLSIHVWRVRKDGGLAINDRQTKLPMIDKLPNSNNPDTKTPIGYEETSANSPAETDHIFPKDSSKSYALVELMPDDSPMVNRGPDDTIFSFPAVLLWEAVLLLGVTLFLFLFSLVKQAPLDEIANPLITTDPAKAPWYFVGLQEMLEHMHPFMAGVFIPGVLVLFLVTLPYIDNSREDIGIWFASKRGRRITIMSAIYAFLLMPTYILLDNAFTLRELLRDSVPQWVAQGLVPAGILFGIVALPTLVLWRRKASRREIMLALFTILIVSALIFTLSGFLFRGPGFKLYWPWEMPNGYNPLDEL